MTRAADARMLQEVESIVVEASEHLLASFEKLSHGDVEHKGAIDLVTRLDREAQDIVQSGLQRAFPGETIVAEEDVTSRPGRRETLWLVDPLDGTTNFVHGLPIFAVSVARVREGALELAVVHAPCLRERYSALVHQGAFRNGARLRVSTRSDRLDGALLATGFPYDIRSNPINNLAEWSHLAVRCRGLRRCGAAALDLAWVAAGRFEGFWEYRLQPWDLAAGALLIQEAGGVVTDIDGGNDFLWSGNLVAGSPPIHRALLQELDQVRAQGSR
jgi:myo-inositol-1(or 4)-monophosphatase